jgi:hypothetical protein
MGILNDFIGGRYCQARHMGYGCLRVANQHTFRVLPRGRLQASPAGLN